MRYARGRGQRHLAQEENMTDEPKMTLPTVHLNGTSADQLLKQLIGACDAVRAAIEAVQRAAPNGRDYYPQGPDAIHLATAAHYDRLSRLRSVLSEIELVAVHVADQQYLARRL